MEFLQTEEATGSGVNPTQLELILKLEEQNNRVVKLMGKVEELDRGIKNSEQFILVNVQKNNKHVGKDGDGDM